MKQLFVILCKILFQSLLYLSITGFPILLHLDYFLHVSKNDP